MPNWQEFRAGTDPNDVRSRLQLLVSGLTGLPEAPVRLHWPTGPNCRYRLEWATRLGDSNWTVLATNLLGDGSVREFVDTNSVSGPRFYRVRAE